MQYESINVAAMRVVDTIPPGFHIFKSEIEEIFCKNYTPVYKAKLESKEMKDYEGKTERTPVWSITTTYKCKDLLSRIEKKYNVLVKENPALAGGASADTAAASGSGIVAGSSSSSSSSSASSKDTESTISNSVGLPPTAGVSSAATGSAPKSPKSGTAPSSGGFSKAVSAMKNMLIGSSSGDAGAEKTPGKKRSSDVALGAQSGGSASKKQKL